MSFDFSKLPSDKERLTEAEEKIAKLVAQYWLVVAQIAPESDLGIVVRNFIKGSQVGVNRTDSDKLHTNLAVKTLDKIPFVNMVDVFRAEVNLLERLEIPPF